jgi:hypothetical protein
MRGLDRGAEVSWDALLSIEPPEQVTKCATDRWKGARTKALPGSQEESVEVEDGELGQVEDPLCLEEALECRQVGPVEANRWLLQTALLPQRNEEALGLAAEGGHVDLGGGITIDEHYLQELVDGAPKFSQVRELSICGRRAPTALRKLVVDEGTDQIGELVQPCSVVEPSKVPKSKQ